MRQADEQFNVTLTGLQMAEISIALGLASLVGMVEPRDAQTVIDHFITVVPGLREEYNAKLRDLKERDIQDTDPL